MLVFSFGINKSASTFTYELLRELYAAAGFPQTRLPQELRGYSDLNFMSNLTDEYIGRALAQSGESWLVVKTHEEPGEAVYELLATGQAYAYANYRDPKDAALALVDAGNYDRRNNLNGGFRGIRRLTDTFTRLHSRIYNLERWLDAGAVPLLYEQVCFSTARVAADMGRRIGLAVARCQEVAESLDRRKHTIEQWNRGVEHRHLAEMSVSDRQLFDETFGYFYRAHPECRPPGDGAPV